MTCSKEGPVDLGQAPLPLQVHVRPGEAWDDSIVLIAVATDGTETPLTWPAAPVLQFGPEATPILEVPGTLSDYTDPDTTETTTDALAVWSMTNVQTQLLKSYMEARMLVDGRTWLEGRVDA